MSEQQILAEMRINQGTDALRDVLNKYFAFAVDNGTAKMVREVGKDIIVWDMSTFKEWCDNKPATVESIDLEKNVTRKDVPLYPIYKKGRFEYPNGLIIGASCISEPSRSLVFLFPIPDSFVDFRLVTTDSGTTLFRFTIYSVIRCVCPEKRTIIFLWRKQCFIIIIQCLI